MLLPTTIETDLSPLLITFVCKFLPPKCQESKLMRSSGSSSLSNGSSDFPQCVALFFFKFLRFHLWKGNCFCVDIYLLLTNAPFEQSYPYSLLSIPHGLNRLGCIDDLQLPKQIYIACVFQSHELMFGQLLLHIWRLLR